MKRTITAALTAHQTTKDVDCLAVVPLNREKQHFRVLVPTEEMAQKARIHSEWIETHLSGARLRGEPWFPIKVDWINAELLTDESRTRIRNDACEIIGRENKIEVKKISPLGPIHPNKFHCSAIFYLSRQEDAMRILNQRVLDVCGEGAFPKPYEYKDHPKRCFNCHQYDHQRARCKNPQRCGFCAAEGHHKSDCTSPDAKCAACGGPHPANDRGCGAYRMELEKKGSALPDDRPT
jgi:hypothetical protein